MANSECLNSQVVWANARKPYKEEEEGLNKLIYHLMNHGGVCSAAHGCAQVCLMSL